MAQKQLLAKKVVSWLVVTAGLCVGFFYFVRFGSAWISDYTPDRFGLAGWGIVGLTFIVASIIAISNKRVAWMIMLASLPFGAFCLAYPDAGYDETLPDRIVYCSALPLTAIGLAVLFFVPFLAPLAFIRNKKRAAYVFAALTLGAYLLLRTSNWTWLLIPRVAAWSLLFLPFVAYWWVTQQAGWPPLVVRAPRSLGKRIAAIVATCFVVLCVDITLTMGFATLGSSLWTPDCSGRRLFISPIFKGHTVLTARIILTGLSREARREIAKYHDSARDDAPPTIPKRKGDWAIGIVQEKFWGLPWWTPHVVLLTDHIFWEGETYFVDGLRSEGLLTRFLPIVHAGFCSRTRPATHATLELRLLRGRPNISGLRLTGWVRGPESYSSGIADFAPTPPTAVPGATIVVTGPLGTRKITTDQDGIYELDAPRGDYTLTMELPDTQYARVHELKQQDFRNQQIIEANFYVGWNGTITGRISNATGPSDVSVQLLNPDEPNPLRKHVTSARADHNGRFSFHQLSPGRYLLVANALGPTRDWPYGPLYYPHAIAAKDAQVLAMAGGQRISDLNLSLGPRLAERRVRVRVAWPNGRPVEGASVNVLYEHTAGYDAVFPGGQSATSDGDGLAEISVFGDSRIKVLAQKSVEASDPAASRYNVPVELQASRLPATLNLILTSPERPHAP